MTTLKEKVDHVAEVLARTKESWVADNPENTDLLIYVHVFRDDDMVAALHCVPDRDIGLQVCHIARSGLRATSLAMTFEAYHTALEVSPVTGRMWEPHEMQFVCETMPEAREKGWVTESLTTMAVDTEGHFALYAMPYVIKEGEVIWGESSFKFHDDGEVSGGGYMYGVMTDIMSQGTVLEAFLERTKNDALAQAIWNSMRDEPDRREFHTDAAALQAMMERELIVAATLHAPSGSLREELIQERWGDQIITAD